MDQRRFETKFQGNLSSEVFKNLYEKVKLFSYLTRVSILFKVSRQRLQFARTSLTFFKIAKFFFRATEVIFQQRLQRLNGTTLRKYYISIETFFSNSPIVRVLQAMRRC